MKKIMVLGAVSAAPAWFFARIFKVQPYGDALRAWVDQLKSETEGRDVLELGCGPGDLAGYLAEEGWNVTALDQSDKMLNSARARIENVAFVKGNALASEFPADQFDLILSASLLNVVPDPTAMVAEMKRLCRPGGLVSVLFPTDDFDLALAQFVCRDAGLSGFDQASIEVWASAARKLDPTEVAVWFADAEMAPSGSAAFFNGGVRAMTFRHA